MSEAPHLELNNVNLGDLDPSAPSSTGTFSNGNYTNGSTKSKATENTNGILNCKVGDKRLPYLAETQPNAVHDSLICSSHTIPDLPSNTLTAAAQSAQNAMAAVQNHPVTQSVQDTVTNGPVAQNVKAEAARTGDEFADLANARQTPEHPAATGQPLTHYHSFFYRLLSWKNPRATAIAFAGSVLFIFAARYLNIIRYVFKLAAYTLGATATAEFGGKLAFGRGLTTQIRPKKYFTIPKASLERLLDDVEQLINFFVIESQRVVFAENVYVTGAAFFASLISYFLIKFVPLWGLTLIATTIAYLGPLIYVKNKEAIDAQLQQGYNLVNAQAKQVKDLASQHTANAANTIQGLSKDYTHKAQETINSYRGRSASPEISNKVKREDFPAAPTHPVPEKEPLLEPVM